jgi:hypothetical protein
MTLYNYGNLYTINTKWRQFSIVKAI